MAGEPAHRYICFCGAFVVSLPVCSACAKRMVAMFLGEMVAFSDHDEATGPRSLRAADEGLERGRCLPAEGTEATLAS